MRLIDRTTWPRRHHLETFLRFERPHTAVCAPVDVTPLVAAVRAQGGSLFATLLHAACVAANAVPELRQRLRGEDVVEHDVVHPSFTVAGPDDAFRFCPGRFEADPERFRLAMREAMDAAAGALPLAEAPGDDRIFVSSLPWVAFASVEHPMKSRHDCVPRIAWGRVETTAGASRVPLSLTAHHGLVDGVHMGRFFRRFEEIALRAESVVGRPRAG